MLNEEAEPEHSCAAGLVCGMMFGAESKPWLSTLAAHWNHLGT